MKTPITLLIIALAAAACSPISEEGKEAMAQPINCPTAEQDIAVLESERASVLDRLASGAQFVVLLNRRRWRTRVELANAIFEYLEIFHNRQRRHSSIDMLTPIEYENRYTQTA